MTPEKKAARKARNKAAKIAKAAARRANLALVGKLVYENTDGFDIETEGGPTEIKILDLPPAIRTARDGSILPLKETVNETPARVAGYGSTSLLFLSAKQHRQHGLSSRNRPGQTDLHSEAIVEDASRTFAKAVEEALSKTDDPTAVIADIPVIPMNAAEEASQL